MPVCVCISTHIPCAQWKEETHERQASKSCNEGGRRSGGELTQEALLSDKMLEKCKRMTSVRSHRNARMRLQKWGEKKKERGETGFDRN